MNKQFLIRKSLLAICICLIVVTTVAWQGQPSNTKQSFIDTPRKKVKDIEEALEQLEKSKAELEKTLKEKNWDAEVKEAMKGFDSDKIKCHFI